jgi:hypothetical protein
MCSNRPATFLIPAALLLASSLHVAVAVAQSPILTEPRRPFAFTPGGNVAASDNVWSAVILASNAKKGAVPSAIPPELAPFAAKLSKFFSCDQFEILGSATRPIDSATERWLVPTQNFWIGTRATRERGGYRMNIEFYHDKRRLLETEAILGPKSPLIIRGPVHPRGQLIIVFEIKP